MHQSTANKTTSTPVFSQRTNHANYCDLTTFGTVLLLRVYTLKLADKSLLRLRRTKDKK